MDGWMEEESGCGNDPLNYEKGAEEESEVARCSSHVLSYFI
jgi:hypothetical protein